MNDPSRDLQQLQHIADKLLSPGADLAPRTRINLWSRYERYLEFARRHGLAEEAEQIEPLDVAAFVVEKIWFAGLKSETVGQYLYGIAHTWRGLTGQDAAIDSTARLVLNAARQAHPPRARRPAVIIPRWLLLEMLEQMAPGRPGYDVDGSGRRAGAWRAKRDRALIALLFGGLLRPAEALEADVELTLRRPGGWELRLPTSKTDPTGSRPPDVVFIADNDLIGSGRILSDWLRTRGSPEGSALIPGETDGLPLSHDRASRRVRAAAARCGHSDDAVSLYSFRRTAATLAVLAGASHTAVSRRMRHRSLKTTGAYIDSLRHIIDYEDVKPLYLSETRPTGASANDLGRGVPKRQFPSIGDSDTTDDTHVPIDQLRDLAEETARRGLLSVADSTLANIEASTRSWRDFCTRFSLDHAGPDPMDVAAWVLWRRRSGQRSGDQLHRAVCHLERAFQAADPLTTPPTAAAKTVVKSLRRADADTVPQEETQAPVYDRDVILSCVQAHAPKPPDTRDLDIAILRWTLARAGTKAPGRGVVFHRDVHVGCGGQWLDITIAGTTTRLLRSRSALTCPVRAAERLLADPREPLIHRWKINTGRLHPRGLHGRVEDWTEDDLELGAWVLGTPLRKLLRARLLICVSYAGLLRMADLREARIEELDRDQHGYVLHLGRSKTNRANHAEPLRLQATGDDLCPVKAIEAWREVWPTTTGPLLARRVDHHAFRTDLVDHADASSTSLLIDSISRRSGIRLTGHTFRRSRATHEWYRHRDVDRIRRLLRHEDLVWTYRYIEGIDLVARDITKGIAAVEVDVPLDVQQVEAAL